MSLSGNGGSNALKAPAFIVGIAVLIITVLYVTKRCGPNLFGQETVSRNYFRGSNDPPEITSDTGEKPRMCDVWIVSWYPLCSQPWSRSGRLGLGEGQGEDEKKSEWAEFLVSCPTQSIPFGLASSCVLMPAFLDIQPLSADKVSDADTDVSSSQAKSDNPVRSTSSTQIQVSIIILMPAPSRPTSPPSTSSPNPASHDIYDPPREYALGTSYVPYTPGD